MLLPGSEAEKYLLRALFSEPEVGGSPVTQAQGMALWSHEKIHKGRSKQNVQTGTGVEPRISMSLIRPQAAIERRLGRLI